MPVFLRSHSNGHDHTYTHDHPHDTAGHDHASTSYTLSINDALNREPQDLHFYFAGYHQHDDVSGTIGGINHEHTQEHQHIHSHPISRQPSGTVYYVTRHDPSLAHSHTYTHRHAHSAANHDNWADEVTGVVHSPHLYLEAPNIHTHD